MDEMKFLKSIGADKIGPDYGLMFAWSGALVIQSLIPILLAYCLI